MKTKNEIKNEVINHLMNDRVEEIALMIKECNVLNLVNVDNKHFKELSVEYYNNTIEPWGIEFEEFHSYCKIAYKEIAKKMKILTV